MIDPADIRKAFEADGPAKVRRNLAAGTYSPEVANTAERWLDDTEDQAATRLETSLREMQGLVRQATIAATAAALGSLITMAFVLLELVRRH